MQAGVFVTGTDTTVGKTWMGQAIIRQLRGVGMNVVPRKPVESGWQENVYETDAGLLAQAAGCIDVLEAVCPHRFEAAVSPTRAATLAGQRLFVENVRDHCFSGVSVNDFLYVEGAGGFLSPLVSNGLNADLAKALGLPVVIVVGDRLGCINHTLLTLMAVENYGLRVAGIILNSLSHPADLCLMNNFEDLKSLTKVPVFQVRYQQGSVPQALIDLLLD